jgi:hypothetical protein
MLAIGRNINFFSCFLIFFGQNKLIFFLYFSIFISNIDFELQVSHHPPMSAGHAENEHFTHDVTSKLKTKFLGNSVDVYPVGR